MPEIPLPPEILKEIMNELRDQTHAKMEKELQERMEKSPEPNEEELRIGAFREELEPQVRDAILEFFRKGYSTESSGFYEDQSGEEIQAIDGYFEIDKETEAKLKALGARVLRGPETGLPYQNEKFTRIQFKPNTPDLRDMRQQWDVIAALLPDRGSQANPSLHGADFLEQHAPERKDIEAQIIARNLELKDIEPETEQQMRARLAKLQKRE